MRTPGSVDAPDRVSTGAPQRVRIIAGDWGGRWLDVVDAPGLRPTGNRVRETLFNWLQMHVPGARCLDLFAGSGALGLEAASRGAAQVTLVEREPRVIENLRQQLVRFGESVPSSRAGSLARSSHRAGSLVESSARAGLLAGTSGIDEHSGTDARVVLMNSDGHAFLAQCDTSFDLVFLDPPFDAWSGDVAWLSDLLSAVHGVLADVARVYLESPASFGGESLVPAGWEVMRQRVYGEVMATLYEVNSPSGS